MKQQQIEKENKKFARKFSTPHTSMYTGVKEVFLFACNFCTLYSLSYERQKGLLTLGLKKSARIVSFVTVFLFIVFVFIVLLCIVFLFIVVTPRLKL